MTSRLERQQITNRERPVPLVVVLDAMVLRRPVSGHPGVLADQLTRLAKAAEVAKLPVRAPVPLRAEQVVEELVRTHPDGRWITRSAHRRRLAARPE
ncbi:Scr1 family TA system antitoxin-like transcriptional regulator [Micromonospora sp. RTGN7]|uniref:Scr1 family TA system antitoxin-like transcriptional regulator n=1 Tax=Micromonospora sp. RTGN7 TaxID=3016526 RepID=UPI0029FF02A3|nr:Scr1 family TA system antitoxin-like transcriptional regulator [Micromonospora sp. RTGN7]